MLWLDQVQIVGVDTCAQFCTNDEIGSVAPAVGENVPGIRVNSLHGPWQADVKEADAHVEEERPPAKDCQCYYSINGDDFFFPYHVQLESFIASLQHLVGTHIQFL